VRGESEPTTTRPIDPPFLLRGIEPSLSLSILRHTSALNVAAKPWAVSPSAACFSAPGGVVLARDGEMA
jgi:hypothetical protein